MLLLGYHDPRRDIEIYLERARQLGLQIPHSLETHIHADFVSGTRELQERLNIPILAGCSNDYQFNYQPLEAGDTLTLSSLILEVFNIALGPAFPTWIGWMVDPEQSLLLMTESPETLKQVTEHLFRLGYDRVIGYLHGGMVAWQTQGLPLQRLLQMPVRELHEQLDRDDLTILDVRSDQEFVNGAVPHAQPLYLPHLEEKLDRLDPTKTVATYGGSGYRASIAASLLQRHGLESVINIPGSWKAWQFADLPVEQPSLV